MARISWFSAEAMLILLVMLLVTYLVYNRCNDFSSNRIPTRRSVMIAENSIILDAHDLELRK